MKNPKIVFTGNRPEEEKRWTSISDHMPLDDPLPELYKLADEILNEMDQNPDASPEMGQEYAARMIAIHADIRATTVLGKFWLAKSLYEFVRNKRDEAAQKILNSPNFDLLVIKKMVEWADLDESQRTERLKKELEIANEFVSKVTNGKSKRADQVDKRNFIEWVLKNDIVVNNTAELLNQVKENGPAIHTYRPEVYKAWYKEAMPHVVFRSGRPKQ